ncbi:MULTISPECIES: hypothetical protein [Streptomyces]|nr:MULTISPECIES: hypothetical protein [unclassified Streptomyces]
MDLRMDKAAGYAAADGRDGERLREAGRVRGTDLAAPGDLA